MFQLELTKPTKDGMFGFAVEAELAEDYDRDDELQVYVCDITPGGVAETRGELACVACLWVCVRACVHARVCVCV